VPDFVRTSRVLEGTVNGNMAYTELNSYINGKARIRRVCITDPPAIVGSEVIAEYPHAVNTEGV
jgi:hypothetical protein